MTSHQSSSAPRLMIPQIPETWSVAGRTNIPNTLCVFLRGAIGRIRTKRSNRPSVLGNELLYLVPSLLSQTFAGVWLTTAGPDGFREFILTDSLFLCEC